MIGSLGLVLLATYAWMSRRRNRFQYSVHLVNPYTVFQEVVYPLIWGEGSAGRLVNYKMNNDTSGRFDGI